MMDKPRLIFPLVVTKGKLSFIVFVEGRTAADTVIKVLTGRGNKVKCDTTNDARLLFNSAQDAIIGVSEMLNQTLTIGDYFSGA